MRSTFICCNFEGLLKGIESLLKGNQMMMLFKIFVWCLVADLIFLVAQIIARLFSETSFLSQAEMTPTVIIAGVLTALITLIINQFHKDLERLHKVSGEYLKHATSILSKAYENFSSKDPDYELPLNSRINWLTAARLIKTAEDISHLITEDTHQRIWEDEKEYWRGKFRDQINPRGDKIPGDRIPEKYYTGGSNRIFDFGKNGEEPLSEKSIAVLWRFIQWSDEAEDPIKNEPKF